MAVLLVAVPGATLADPTPPPAGIVEDAGAPSWPKGTHTVLHIGDSMVGHLQFGLAKELEKKFAAVGIVYRARVEESAGFRTFAQSRKTETYIREMNPDVVLLSLGTNNLSVPRPEAYEAHVRSIVEQVGSRPCYWIGPLSIAKAVAKQTTPDTPKDPNAAGLAVVAMLKRTTTPCRYYDSYALSIPREKDDVHPTVPGAARWADKIWTFLAPVPP
jgi:lysophospholipase L1-like esterase